MEALSVEGVALAPGPAAGDQPNRSVSRAMAALAKKKGKRPPSVVGAPPMLPATDLVADPDL